MMIGECGLAKIGNVMSTTGYDNFNLKQFAPIFSVTNNITVRIGFHIQ